MTERFTASAQWRIAGLLLGVGVLLTLASAPVVAADAPPASDPGAPPPVNTNTHPDAIFLNAKNPLAIHAGPGKPNVGTIFIPPTLSGKDKGKGAKSGQTEQAVMGATPKH